MNPNETEPAATNGGVVALFAGLVILVISRLNRAWDVLSVMEMSDLKTWLAAAGPLLAAYLIRRKVVPVAKHENAVQFSVAAGYAQGLEDKAAEQGPPPANP